MRREKMNETKKAISELIADKDVFKMAKEITVSEANRCRCRAGNALARLGSVSSEEQKKLRAAVFLADLIDAIEREYLEQPVALVGDDGNCFKPSLPGDIIQ